MSRIYRVLSRVYETFRRPPVKKVGPFEHNPVMIGYDNRLFQPNADLGYTFPNSKLVDPDRFVDLEEKLDGFAKLPDNWFVLNIGDSSTSGWNSNNVQSNDLNPKRAFFSYKTYSDILAEKPRFYQRINVLNAGVPGYTSYQAKKYLPKLLKEIARRKIYIDHVTLYLGNNDCAHNGMQDKTRIDFMPSSSADTFMRVSKEDFKNNIQTLLHDIRQYGATPIILIPASNHEWPPGLRSRKYPEELSEARGAIAITRISGSFQEAEEAYRRQDYAAALDKDLLLPRIKASYKEVLKTFETTGVPCIDVQRLVQDPGDFIDYCHPSEALNERIADSIIRLLWRRNAYHHIMQYDKPLVLPNKYNTYPGIF